MDEYVDQLELLLSQDNFVEASNSMEKALACMQIPSTLSRVTPLEPSMLTAPTKTSNLIGGCLSQQQLAEKNIYYHLGEYLPQGQLRKENYLYQIEGGYHPHEQPLEENFYHVMVECPPQHTQQQQVPLRGYNGLENQVPYIDQQTLFAFIGPNPTYLNPSGNPMDPNWDAIDSFLLGQVRPGPDIARVYKCGICSIEFPNAQAFGGHMSSHSKCKRRQMIPTSKGQFKKVKWNPSSSTKTEKATIWPLSRKLTLQKETKNDKENKKVDYKSDESMSNSFLYKKLCSSK